MRRFAIMLVVASATRVAAAPSEPIVLASGDEAFRAALAAALAPAGMTVMPSENAPSPTIGDVAAQSRDLADGKHASATVWLVVGDAAALTLVTYDRDVDRVLVRSLPYALPLTPEQAAEAARMARTMLRALRVTPDVNLPPPHADEAVAVRAQAAESAMTPAHAVEQLPSVLALEIDGGARIGGPAESSSAEGVMALVWRPDQLGALVAVAVAPNVDVRTAGFMGTATDDSLALAARWPIHVLERLSVAGIAGAAVHYVKIEGAVDQATASVARFDPSARVGLTATYAKRSVGINLGITADWLVRRQLYEVGAADFRIPSFQLSIGLGLTARLF